MNKIYGEKIGFIGLGKLGMPCAETIAQKGFEVVGYDIENKSSNHIEIRDSIAEVCRDTDIVFVATPTPHEEGYDGREPSSHKEPKDFNYDSLKKVLEKCNRNMGVTQSLVLISTVLPGTIRRELAPLVTNVKLLSVAFKVIKLALFAIKIKSPELFTFVALNSSMLSIPLILIILISFFSFVGDN